jgi:hypothetical protein
VIHQIKVIYQRREVLLWLVLRPGKTQRERPGQIPKLSEVLKSLQFYPMHAYISRNFLVELAAQVHQIVDRCVCVVWMLSIDSLLDEMHVRCGEFCNSCRLIEAMRI